MGLKEVGSAYLHRHGKKMGGPLTTMVYRHISHGLGEYAPYSFLFLIFVNCALALRVVVIISGMFFPDVFTSVLSTELSFIYAGYPTTVKAILSILRISGRRRFILFPWTLVQSECNSFGRYLNSIPFSAWITFTIFTFRV